VLELTAIWPVLAALAVTAVASIYDLRTGHIPNWLTLGAWGFALGAHASVGALHFGAGEGVVALACSLAGAVVTALVPLLLYSRRGLGGGDVKLLAAVGALCGVSLGMDIELGACVVAALYAGAKLAHRGRLLSATGAAFQLLPRLVWTPRAGARRRTPGFGELRFAPSVFVATGVAVLVRLTGAL